MVETIHSTNFQAMDFTLMLMEENLLPIVNLVTLILKQIIEALPLAKTLIDFIFMNYTN
jgi:hypothetical protein